MLWDGTYIGEIELDELDEIDSLKLINFNGQMIYIKPYNNEEKYKLIIADELKHIFGIMKIGTHSCSIKNKKYILYRYHESSNLAKYIKNKNDIDDTLRYNIQICFMFRIIMGFCKNFESNILILPINESIILPTTIYSKVNYGNTGHMGSTLPRTIINKWFDGNWRNVYKLVQSLFKKINDESKQEKFMLKLCDKIESIIEKIDRNEKFWAVEITEKIKHFFMEI